MRALRIVLAAMAAALLMASCGGPAEPAGATEALTTAESTTAAPETETATEAITEPAAETTAETTTEAATAAPTEEEEPETAAEPISYPAEAVTIQLTFGGDCTLGTANGQNQDHRFPKTYERSGSLTYPFDGIKHIFEQDDLTVINFEGTLTTATEEADKAWRFKGPPEYAKILPASSIEAASLANNHAPRDFLEQGYSDTKKHLKAAGVGLLYKDSPLIKVIHGVEVVLIGGNTAYVVKDRAVNGVLKQIRQHKRKDNVVIAVMHWGTEHTYEPDAFEKETARSIIKAGADLVVGHHPHAMQGIETYQGKYIVYSLGNLAYGGNSLARNKETILLNASIQAGGGLPPTVHIAVTPCYITSSSSTNADGVLRNNYQPIVVKGQQAKALKVLLLERSALLKNGVTDIALYG